MYYFWVLMSAPSLSEQLFDMEKEVHVHRVAGHTTFSNSTSPYYFGSLSDLQDKSSVFYQIVESANSSLVSTMPPLLKSKSPIHGTPSTGESEQPHMLLAHSPSGKPRQPYSSTLFDIVGSHPNVARIYTTTTMAGAVSKANTGEASVVMEYVHGVSVGTFLRVLSVLKKLGGVGIDKNNASVGAISKALLGSANGSQAGRLAPQSASHTDAMMVDGETGSKASIGVTMMLLQALEQRGCDSEDLASFSEMYSRFGKIESIAYWSGNLLADLAKGVLFL